MVKINVVTADDFLEQFEADQLDAVEKNNTLTILRIEKNGARQILGIFKGWKYWRVVA